MNAKRTRAISMRHCRSPFASLAALFLTANLFAAEKAASPLNERLPLRPELDAPLRDPVICQGPNPADGGTGGTYYLTGTTPIEGRGGKLDFNNCRGLRVWASTNLTAWQDLGFVWDRWDPKQNDTSSHRGCRSYQGELLPLPGLPPGERACGMTAPRIVFDEGRFWVGYSVCGFAAGVMASKGADIKGPWRDYRLVAEAHGAETDRSDAMVFVDTNRTRYLLWGGGCIAKLRSRADLETMNQSDAGFAEEGVEGDVRYLPALIEGFPGDDGLPEHGDPYGVFLFLREGVYHFLFAATTYRAGGIHQDAYVATSKDLFGPYSKPRPLVLDAGRCTAFTDPEGAWRLAYANSRDQLILEPWPNSPASVQKQEAVQAARATIVEHIPRPAVSEKPADVEQDVEMIEPLFDHPLRDAAICRGPQGDWYMVGTEASKGSGVSVQASGQNAVPPDTRHPTPETALDWSNNNGIRLWNSADMKTWADKGYVWDCDTDGQAWNKTVHLDRTCGARPLIGRAVTAPEIHFLKNTFWIVYSMNGQGIGILKSKTGKAEGPYEDLGRLTHQGRDPSLFQAPPSPSGSGAAGDGVVYLAWGQGFYAKLSDDLTRLAGPVKTLFTNVRWYPRYMRRIEIMGQWGSHIVKAGDWYIWNFTTRTGRSGINSIDTLASWSKSLDGPWGEPCIMLVNGGQSTLVRDPASGGTGGTGKYFATVSGEDELAQCPYIPAITEVNCRGFIGPYPAPKPLSELIAYSDKGCQSWFYAVNSVKATELDFWIGNPKFIDCGIRDVWMGPLGDDGYIYLSGSFWAQKRWRDQVAFYRSKDLIHWESKPGSVYTLDRMKALPTFPTNTYDQAIEKWKALGSPDKRYPIEIFENKAYRFSDALYVWVGTMHAGKYVFKSTSGTMDGPFQWVRSDVPFPCEFLQDDDGTLLVDPPAWLGRGQKGETLETVDFQKLAKHAFRHACNLDMMEDCEVGVRKIGGKYMTWSTDWNGNYDMQYRVADTIEGPWRNLRIGAPHGGNGELFQRQDGSWWYAGFYNCNDFATRCGDTRVFPRIFIMPLYVGWRGDELIIEPEAVRRNRVRLEQLGALWQSPRSGT